MKYQSIFFLGVYIFNSFFSLGQEMQQKSNAASTPTVLFICEHGAGMSPIAAAHFNRIANEKGLNVQATFRGIDPDSILGPAIQKGLLKDEFNITGWKPKPISKNDTENAYQIVTLNCDLPMQFNTNKPAMHWNNVPIKEGYVQARDDLERRVKELVDSLITKKFP
jgi:arsenate reductase